MYRVVLASHDRPSVRFWELLMTARWLFCGVCLESSGRQPEDGS